MTTIIMGGFAVLAIIGIPIAMVLGMSSVIAIVFGSNLPLVVVAQRMFTSVDSFPLLAIPLFMIAGSLMDSGGISRRLINFANSIIGWVTGGLSIVAILTCMFFAAISGSGPATVAAIGGIMIPAMEEAGYDKAFAAAVMAIAGAIGVVIPPSIPMVTYGVLSGVSVGGLFSAGFLPGFLIGFCLMIVAYVISKKRGYGVNNKTKFSIGNVLKTFAQAFWAILMPVIILGGIYRGIFTPTEAAAVSVIYGFLIGIFVYRELKLNMIGKVLASAAKSTAMVMLIIACASVFGWILTSERIPDAIASALLSVSDSKIIILLIINIMLLIVGCFMETQAAIIILAPIFIPIIISLGVHPMHFGLIMIVNLAIGMATPPLGVNLFVACGINKVSIEKISIAVVPFLIANIIALFLITYIEPISMFLPKLLGQA